MLVEGGEEYRIISDSEIFNELLSWFRNSKEALREKVFVLWEFNSKEDVMSAVWQLVLH